MRTNSHIYTSHEALSAFIEEYGLKNENHVLVQVFSGVLDPIVLEAVRNTLITSLPQAKILGTTTDGEILKWDVESTTILLSFSVFENTRIRTTHARSTPGGSFQDGEYIAEQLSAADLKIAIVFAEGLLTNGEELMKGFESIHPAVTVAWGLAGDNGTFSGTYVFTEEVFLKDGVVAAGLYGTSITAVTDYAFDWITIGKKLTITKSDRNRVYEIDGLPTVDIYRKYFGDSTAERLPAIGNEFPLIILKNGHKIARGPLSKHDDGSLTFGGNIHEWETVQFGLGDARLILDTSHKLHERFQGLNIETFFVYSCMARRRFLQEHIALEMQPLETIAPTSGFFTYGEFFHDKGHNEFLNQTMTVLALTEYPDKPAQFHDIPPAFVSTKNRRYIDTIQALLHLVNVTSTELEDANNSLQHDIESKVEEINTTHHFYSESYKEIIDNSTVAIWMGDINEVTVWVNRLFTELSQYTPEEAVGKKSFEFFTQESWNAIHQHIALRHQWEKSEYDVELLAKNGDIIPVRLTGIPLGSAGSVGMMMDMREYNSLEKERKHLEDLNILKDDFINIASHELRTPLTSIKGYTSMLLEGDFGQITPEMNKPLSVMLDSSNRLIKLINDMLNIAKLESRNMDFENTDISTQEFFADLKYEYENVARSHWLDFVFDIQWDSIVHTDRNLLKQVLVNLIWNAFKFTPSGGIITICTTHSPHTNRLKIEVIDTGIGMTEEGTKKIFSKFSQLDNVFTRTQAWTGLGLAISQEIVTQMWGKIVVSSTPGKWSNFSFSLPVILSL